VVVLVNNQLSNRHAEVIAFEAAGTWRRRGNKEAVVRERFGYSMTRYHQVLGHAIQLPGALEFDPVTVHRLLERRHTLISRSVRRVGFEI
jgi:hypothetical protein